MNETTGLAINYQKAAEKTISFEEALNVYRDTLLPTYSQMSILGKQPVNIVEHFLPIGMIPEDNPDHLPISECSEVVNTLRRSGQKIVIKGMPGTGKTTFVRKLMHDFCLQKSDIFPVYLKATTIQTLISHQKPSDYELVDTFSFFVNAQVQKIYSDVLLANDIFRQNSTCIIIDGLDEMRPENQVQFCQKLNEFAIYYPQCMLIVTTRIYGLETQSSLSEFGHYLISELNDHDIKKYIDYNMQIEPEQKEHAFNAIKHDEKLYELAKVPFMLALMCVEPDCLKEGSTRKAELYREATAYLLGFKSWEPRKEKITADAANNLTHALQIIAVNFFKLDADEQFPADEARFFIKSKLGDVLGDESILETICKKSGLLQYSNGMFCFVHRSIWEYYVAEGMLREPLVDLLQRANVPSWEEPIRMYVGLTPKDKLKEVIYGLWERNKALTLRTLHEVETFPTELLNELYSRLSINDRINLVHTLRENVYSISNDTQRKRMLLDTVSSLKETEKECEVIYQYILLLEDAAYPECIQLVRQILDLDNAQERRHKYLQGHFRFEMLAVKSGEFMQGSDSSIDEREYPAHKVHLDNFYMSKNLITNAMYYDDFPFVNLERKKTRSYSTQPMQPVNNINWYEAYIFARWIGCELPTESEWEYCCRSGGEDDDCFRYESNIAEHGWYGVNSDNKTHEVATKKPNTWGFCDMLGNLREWCSDWHRDDYYKDCVSKQIINNPEGPIAGESKVLRGGCFDWAITNLRPTYRNFNRPNVNFFGNGFRVVFREKEELL